jgi:hypothetical protein
MTRTNDDLKPWLSLFFGFFQVIIIEPFSQFPMVAIVKRVSTNKAAKRGRGQFPPGSHMKETPYSWKWDPGLTLF